MFPNLTELVNQLNTALQFICAKLNIIATATPAIERTAKGLSAEYGDYLEDRQNGVFPRQVTQPPYAWEGKTSNEKVVETIHPVGKRLIFGGHYANLGDNPFKVRVLCPGGDSPEHTIPPGTSYPITSFVRAIVIIPIDQAEAFYQVIGR